MHAYVHTYILTYIHTYIRTCMHACIRTYIHACMHAYVHTYMHACIRTYIQEPSPFPQGGRGTMTMTGGVGRPVPFIWYNIIILWYNTYKHTAYHIVFCHRWNQPCRSWLRRWPRLRQVVWMPCHCHFCFPGMNQNGSKPLNYHLKST